MLIRNLQESHWVSVHLDLSAHINTCGCSTMGVTRVSRSGDSDCQHVMSSVVSHGPLNSRVAIGVTGSFDIR